MGRLFFVPVPFPERLVTERLVLHRWTVPAHTAALTALNARPETVRFLNAGVPYTAAESELQSARFADHWTEFGFGLWAVEAQGAIVGFTGVCHPRWFPAYAHVVEAGWRLHPSAWGRGYATEAGRAALEAAFAHLELPHVSAFIDDGNDASIAVAQRLGMSLDHRAADPDGTGSLQVWRAHAAPAARG